MRERLYVPTFLLAGLAFCLVILASTAAGAQSHPAARLHQQQQAAESLNDGGDAQSPLEDALRPTVRRLVQEELADRAGNDGAVAGNAGGGEMTDPFALVIDKARGSVENLSGNARRIATALPEMGANTDRAFILLTDLQGWPRMWAGIANLAVMLIVAGLIVRLLSGGLHRILPTPGVAPDAGLSPRLGASLVALARNAMLIAAFVATAFLISLAWFAQHDPMRIFLITYLGAVATGMTGWAVAKLMFAPARPARRLVQIDDRAAHRLARWLTAVLTIVGVLGFSVGMVRLLGMPPATLAILLVAAGLLAAGFTASLLLGWQAPADGPGRYRRLWLLIGLGFLTLLWLLAVLSADGTKLLAVVVMFAASALTLYVGALREPAREAARQEPAAPAFPIDPEDAAASVEAEPPEPAEPAEPDEFAEPPAPAPQPPGVLPSARRVIQAALVAAVGLAFLHLLGVNMVAAQQSPTGQRVTAILGDVAIILIVAAVAWALVERTIRRFVLREEAKARAEASDHAIDEDGLGGMVTSRFGTLLPLIRGFILSVLAAVTIMVVLSSMGLDIGPLLAGAGVVGIAIGFGAQALVRDIISGIFFLIDDAFRVGEYVEFGEIRGQVEQISIRSMRLRHHRGAIHTIPFGELRSITNYNRDWAIYKQEFRLPYETDPEKVRKIIKKVGLRLLEDPELGPKFIQPLKSQGVFKIEEGALIVRTKFMCKPREQFIIRKAVFQEVKKDLYNAGIELAQRRVQIEWPEWAQGGTAGDDTPEGGSAQGGGADTPPSTPAPPSTAQAQAALAGAAVGAAGLVISQQTEKPVYPDEP